MLEVGEFLMNIQRILKYLSTAIMPLFKINIEWATIYNGVIQYTT